MAQSYDSWKTSPDFDDSIADSYIEDKMIANSNSITTDVSDSIKSKFFPFDQLALVIYSAMQEKIDGADKIAKRLGIDGLGLLDIYALTDDFENYATTLRNQ